MACPACGFENPAGMRFCGQCGAALRPAAAAEERKLVTVLFADLVESTRHSAAVDPEQWRERVAKFFALARQEIERFGGTVEKFIGDAVMAVFGLPAIHEDDPERAARAAVSMCVRMRPLIDSGSLPDIRIGINTGEAIANPGAAEKGEFLVTGEAVNLAARLQQHARPGQILVGVRTMEALQRIARLERIDPFVVKGWPEAVSAWALRDMPPPRGRELRATPFVGREEELGLLAGHVRRMMREGRGHVVTILGAGGVGKTRLAHELRDRAKGVQILRGRAIPYGTGVPFWAIGEAIREESGIVFGDPLDIARRKMQDATVALEIPEVTRALLAVLGLGDGADVTREELFAGMRAFFQAVAQRRPLLLILEDMHSAEDVTLDFLEYAADWVRAVPLCLLVLARPQLLERKSVWMGGKRSATTLFLDPLGPEDSRGLVGAILENRPAPEFLVSQLLERAGGNPLFLEEMLRSLIERRVLILQGDRWALSVPVADVAIPDTVQAVIAARLDALPAAEKHVLQAAAIVGKDFYLGAVRVNTDDVPGAAVQALIDKDLIVRKPRSDIADEEAFAFRHILIRDVAYAMIPKSQRWPKHARTAEWLRQIAGDRQAEFADVIAHHWLQVMTLRGELGLSPEQAIRDKAIRNLLVAGDRAERAYANSTALHHYSRALDLDPPAADRLRALLGRGEVWMLLGQHERAREDFSAVCALAQTLGEPRWEAVALDHLGVADRRQDQTAPALEHLGRALVLARQVGDPVLTGRILNHVGFTQYNSGKHEEAIQAHQEARRLLEQADPAAQDPQVSAELAESLHGMGENLHFLGRHRETFDYFTASIAASERAGNRSLAGENQYMIAHARLVLGAYAEAQADIQRSVAMLDEIGDVWNLSAALMSGTRIFATTGQFGKALEYVTRGIGLARQVEGVRFMIYNLLGRGDIHRELEDIHGAWQTDREAVDLADKAGVVWMPLALAFLARDAIALGRLEDAEAALRRAQQVLGETQTRLEGPEEMAVSESLLLLARGQAGQAAAVARKLLDTVASRGVLHWIVPALLLEGESAAALGDPEGSARAYQAAAEAADRQGRLPALWRALAGLAEVQRALGEAAEAARNARRAREVIERLAAMVPDERLKATFLQTERVQRVLTFSGL